MLLRAHTALYQACLSTRTMCTGQKGYASRRTGWAIFVGGRTPRAPFKVVDRSSVQLPLDWEPGGREGELVQSTEFTMPS